MLALPLAAPAGAQSAPPAVSLGGSFGFDTPQIQVANSMNLWKAAGVDVKDVTFGSGRAALEALLGGQVDFVLAAELPAVTGAMRAQSFAVIADLSRYRANRIVTTVPATTIAGLSGQKLGTTIGTSSDFLLASALQHANVKADVVNAAPSDLVPALARGDITGASLFSDFFPQAKKVLGDRYHEIRIPDATHMLVLASREVIAKHPDAVRAVLAALLKADAVIKQTPDAAQSIVAASTSGTVNVADLKAVWSQYDYETRLDQSLLDLMSAEGTWVAAGGMIKNVTPDQALFRSYVDAAPLKALSPGSVSVK
jgi:NitT/TauT family transport system substrate-binding protein